jgi:hypothetical protein
MTFGAGVGGAVDMELGMRDGMALLTVLALMGKDHFENSLQPPKNVKEFVKEQGRELVHAVAEGLRDAQKDPNTGFWARQVLQSIQGTVDIIDEATSKRRA